MIAARLYEYCGAIDVEPGALDGQLSSDDRLLWVDVVDPTDAELVLLQKEFGLHPLAIEDVRERHQRPKLEHYRSHSFLVAYSSTLVEVDFFVGDSWVITVREEAQSEASWPLDGARRRYERTRGQAVSVGLLVYVLLDELVDGYFDAIDSIEENLERLEDRVFAEILEADHPTQEELYTVRRSLLAFRHAVAPLRDVVASMLRKEAPWVDEETAVRLEDVFDHVLRILELIDSNRELLSNAVDAHLVITSNRINASMKRMTSWGAILLGATLVAGIFGMNFQHMPHLHWRFGFLSALGLMLAISAAGYGYFRRRGWL